MAGDCSDWNLNELGILGDIFISVPAPHAKSFIGTLVFTPGALLRNGRGQTPADWAEVALVDDRLNREGYHGLYEWRLLPAFQHVNGMGFYQDKKVLRTMPGLGCGQFADPFAGRLGADLQSVMELFLTLHGVSFLHIEAVYCDLYGERSKSRQEIHGISLIVRPLLQGKRR